MFLSGKHRWGDAVMLVISLIFSCTVWGLMKLSENYSSLFHYKVEVSTNLPGREFTAVSTGPLAVRGNSSGYQLLNHRLETKQNKNIVAINLKPSLFKKVKGGDDRYYILVNQIGSNLKEKVEEKVNFESFSTDTLFFEFKKVATKRVKVALNSKFSFEKEYMPLEKMVLNPDSVDIHGLESIIKTVDSLPTELVKRSGVNEAIQGVAKIVPVKGVEFSQDEVYYSQRVGRYYESKVEVPVTVKNVPEQKILRIVPKSVTVTYRAQYNSKTEFSPEDFEVTVDYRQIVSPIEKGARIILKKQPKGVITARLNKLYLDNYIISEAK